ncbi:hypothetical protein Z950_1722 [Sulfitobacter mediterraneus KCTC 32188]|nr:hypothetical protein Z950_1722 [Sulfitobacter mediterraneus KCTC 32188]
MQFVIILKSTQGKNAPFIYYALRDNSLRRQVRQLFKDAL